MSEDDKSERRTVPDSSARNRRVISRVTDSSIRPQVQLIRGVTLAWVWLSGIYVAALLFIEAPKLGEHLTKSLFESVLVATLAVIVFRLSTAAKSFLENDSQARLAVFAERVYFVLISAVAVFAVLGLVQLISLV
jgi:hypothetical protein